MTTPSASTEIVIDANLAASAVLPGISVAEDVPGIFRRWHESGYAFCAPASWLAEAVSAIRKAVYLGLASSGDAERAVGDLFHLGLSSVELDAGLCRRAYAWAGTLNQIRAYDSFYVALAEREGTEMWTGDRRLANAARQAGAPWVRWIGEA